MNRRRIQRFWWWALVAMIGASVALTLALKRSYSGEDLLLLVWIAYAPVGAVIAHRRPDNPIGWLFLMVGLAASLMGLARVGEWAALDKGPPLEWWGYVSAWVLAGVAFPLIILCTAFTFLLYPSGLASRRWRGALFLGYALIVFSPLFGMFGTRLAIGEKESEGAFEVQNPIGVLFPSALDRSFFLWLALFVTLMVLSVLSSLQRAWRAHGVERVQMRMFAFAIVMLILSVLPAQWLAEHGYSTLRFLFLAAAFLCVPLACALAILRHNLYDIDRIIGRTTAYALVTGVLLGVYVVVVTSLTSLVPESGSTGQADSWAVAVATLVAAGLFRPVLRWARGVVDRRFNREQFDAERAVEAFALRLRDEVEGEEVRSDLLKVLALTVQPSSTGLWLREPTP